MLLVRLVEWGTTLFIEKCQKEGEGGLAQLLRLPWMLLRYRENMK